MLLSCIPVRHVCGQELIVNPFSIRLGHDYIFVPLNVRNNLTPIHDRQSPVQLKCGLAGKCNNVIDRNHAGIFQQPRDRLDMTLVLPEWIAELILVAIDVLSPEFTIFSTVYPSLIVLRFNDKDAVNGNHNMVYLRAVYTGLKKEVIDNSVFLFRKE